MSKKDLRRRPVTDAQTEESTEQHFIHERTLRSPSNLIETKDMGEIEALLRLAVMLSRGKPAEA